MKGCKNCPAYAKCTVTYRSSACEALRGTYGIDSDPEIVTNADKIRGLSNEELALFLDETQRRECEALHVLDPKGFPQFESCVKGWLEWLQMPVEVNTQCTDG